MKKIFVVVSLFLFLSTKLFAQDNLYTLDHCITLAIQNAPELKVSNAVIKQSLANEKKIRTNTFVENLNLSTRGNLINRKHLEYTKQYFIDRDTQVPVWFGWQTDFQVALELTLPFSSGRYKKYDKKFASAQVEEQRAIHLQQINFIKNEVINLYNRYEQTSNDLTTTIESYNSQNIYYKTSKQQYQIGEITEAMFGPIQLAYNDAKLKVSAARTNLKTAYQLLVVRIGEEFSTSKK